MAEFRNVTIEVADGGVVGVYSVGDVTDLGRIDSGFRKSATEGDKDVVQCCVPAGDSVLAGVSTTHPTDATSESIQCGT